MVLRISIDATEEVDDRYYGYDAYTVHVDDHRILTILTDCKGTLTKWLNDVAKFIKNKSPTTLLVGVSAEHRSLIYDKSGLRDQPYDLINLCVGSHCLIYHVNEDLGYPYHRPGSTWTILKSLRDFFDNPRVVAVGMNMKSVAQKLERDHAIKMRNPMDLQEMADCSLGRCNLDKLAKTVLGKHMEVMRPQEINWNGWYPGMQRIKYTTLDAYLSYLVGSELFDTMKLGDVLRLSLSKRSRRRR